MRILRGLSITQRITAIILMVALSTLMAGFTLVFMNDLRAAKRDLLNETTITARLVAEYCITPLAFNDREGANNVLAKLASVPVISAAVLSDAAGQAFAEYRPPSTSRWDVTEVSNATSGFHGDWLQISQPVLFKGERYGTVYLRVSTVSLTNRMQQELLFLLGSMVLLTVISYLLARRLQPIISSPITQLAAAVRNISETKDYTLRVSKHGSDEIGVLYDEFNGLLEQVGRRERERSSAVEALQEEKERALITLQSIGDAVITTDMQGNIEYLNPVAEDLTGWSTAEAQGEALHQVYRVVYEQTREPVPSPVDRCLIDGRTVDLPGNALLARRDDSYIAVEDTAAPIRSRDGTIIGAILVFHDVTRARKQAERMSYQAQHDDLTGLINRREFEDRLVRTLERAKEDGGQHALLFMDLDRFKVVNDTSGHPAGDELLRQVAMLLRARVRQRDTLARFGGDEFAVLLERCGPDEAYQLAETLRKTLQDYRFVWRESSFSIGVSIGLVPLTHESGGLDEVLRLADTACYAAKDAGRNRIFRYQPADGTLAQRHGEMRWIPQITQALEQDRFRLAYQDIRPAVLARNTGPHYEILLRLRENDDTLVTPERFLPAAERYGLMPEIDRWVVRHTLQWLASQPAHLKSLSMCAINLSGQSVGDSDFLAFVDATFRETAVPPEKICFEITETATVANLTSAGHFIAALKDKGCRFALDDFGAGMSSFRYLKHLPVDFLKIDGAFVRNICNDPMDFTMVKSINDMGHILGMETVAEFVEDSAVLNRLAEIGVDYYQGYGIALPLLLEDFTAQDIKSNTG